MSSEWEIYLSLKRNGATLPPNLVIPEKDERVKEQQMSTSHTSNMKWHTMFSQKGRSKMQTICKKNMSRFQFMQVFLVWSEKTIALL